MLTKQGLPPEPSQLSHVARASLLRTPRPSASSKARVLPELALLLLDAVRCGGFGRKEYTDEKGEEATEEGTQEEGQPKGAQGPSIADRRITPKLSLKGRSRWFASSRAALLFLGECPNQAASCVSPLGPPEQTDVCLISTEQVLARFWVVTQTVSRDTPSCLANLTSRAVHKHFHEDCAWPYKTTQRDLQKLQSAVISRSLPFRVVPRGGPRWGYAPRPLVHPPPRWPRC